MFEDIEGVEVVVDDVLIWGETEDQHDSRLVKVLERPRSQILNSTEPNARSRNMKLLTLGTY